MLDFFFWQLLLALLYFLSCQIQEEREKKFIFNSIALASAVAGIYGGLQHFGIDFVQWANSWGTRPSSTFGNPNFAAGWWAMTFPIFIAKFFSEKNKSRWLCFALALLMLANLYWGRTRGAWIAFVCSSLVGTLFWVESKKKVSVSFSAAITGIFVAGIMIFFVLPQIYSLGDPSVVERKFKWATAWQMVKEHPAFGVGAGNLKVNFALYQAKVREGEPYKTHLAFRATSESNVHNEYFQIWAEMGTVGLLSFLAIFICYFLRLFLSLKWVSQEEERVFQIGIATSILAFLLYSLTNFPLHIVPNSCLLFFLLGVSETAFPATKGQKLLTVKKNPALTIATLLVQLFLTKKWILPPLQADYLRLQAEIAAAQQNFSKAVELYHRAIDLDFERSERTAYDLGELYRKFGKIQDALNAYQISVALRNYGEIYNNIGNCYYLLGKREEAIQNWKTAVRLGLPDANAQKQTEKNIQLLEKQ